MTIFLGVDPGLDGACAELCGDRTIIFDTPTLRVDGQGTHRREYDLVTMARFLREVATQEARICAVIEQVHAMPGQGVRSVFTFGVGLGVWLGLLAAFTIPYELVTPQRWKKTMLDGQGKDKDAARFKAQSLFPQIELHRKKHEGRADALLIAEFARRTRS